MTTRSIPPEFRLVAACAMWPPSDRRTEAIRTTAGEPLDWSRFLRVARRHQVVGLVHEGLSQARPDVPPEVVGEIRSQAGTLARENLAMAWEALRLQRLFKDAGVPVLFLKGAALGMLAFGSLGMRAGQDIDLLVPYELLPTATALILDAGYRRFDPPSDIDDARLRLLVRLRKDFGFVQEATGLKIELHWRLFLNPHAMVETSLMAASRIVPLAVNTGLRTMGGEDLFAYLCMHGALHSWSQLKWLADINALVAVASEGNLEHLIRAAEVRGTALAAAQALLLCMRLLATPVPARLISKLTNNVSVRWLETTALNAITTGEGEREPREKRFGTTRGSLSTLLLNRSWRYRLAELNLHMINQTDILSVPLPERLRFLYAALRLPLWAWRHSIRRRN